MIERCGGSQDPIADAIVEELEHASRGPLDSELLDRIDVDHLFGARLFAFELLQIPPSEGGSVERLVNGVREATLGLSDQEWAEVRSSLEATLLTWALSPLESRAP